VLVIAFCDTVAPWGLCNCYAVQVIIIIIIWNFQLHRQLHSLFAVNAAVMMPQSCLSAPLKSAARHFPDNVHGMFACMCRNTWYMNAKSTKRDLWQLLLCVALRRCVCVCVCVCALNVQRSFPATCSCTATTTCAMTRQFSGPTFCLAKEQLSSQTGAIDHAPVSCVRKYVYKIFPISKTWLVPFFKWTQKNRSLKS